MTWLLVCRTARNVTVATVGLRLRNYPQPMDNWILTMRRAVTSLMSPSTPTTFSRAAAPLHTATVSTGATEAGAEVWGLLMVLTGSRRMLVVLVVSMTAVRAGAVRMRSGSRVGESGRAGSLVILVALLLHWPASPGQLAAVGAVLCALLTLTRQTQTEQTGHYSYFASLFF